MTEPRRIVVAGAHGKMGRALVPLLEARDDVEVVGRVGRGDDLRAALRAGRATFLLDVTTPDAVAAHARLALEEGAHAIVATTGLADSERPALDRLARERGRGLLVAPNLSPVVVLLQAAARRLVPYLSRVEILESHHEAKRDAPSGTSRATARQLARAGAKPGPDLGDPAPRGLDVDGVRVHSLRLPGLHARQEIRMASAHEGVTLAHEAYGREAYLAGVLLALDRLPQHVGWVDGLEPLL
ncbi:MAG: 4-hydroxy-tetrahydrodipicolinate reductase [Planctomycetota bacterium]